MGMVVRTNTMAINAYRQLGLNNNAVAKSLEKLASGYRINRAGDDAAGLAISEKMKAQITGLETASANAQDGISLIQTAEGNLSEVHDMLNRMVELATKSANGTYTNIERQALQDEMDQLLTEIDRISKSANFNGTRLLDGSMGLNKDAFAITGSVDATDASNGITSVSTLSASGTSDPDLHFEGDSANQQVAKFKVDLSGVKITYNAECKTDENTKVLLEGNSAFFGTAGLSVTIANMAAETAATAGDIIGYLITSATANTILNYVTTGDGTGDRTSIVVKGDEGNYVFSAKKSDDGNGIDFELIGISKAGIAGGGVSDFTAIDSHDLTKEQAAELNAIMGSDYTVTLSNSKDTAATTPKYEKQIIHNTTNVQEAIAKKDATYAGINLELNGDIVKDGNILTIDGQSFIFKFEGNTAITVTNGQSHTVSGVDGITTATVIDLSSANTAIKLTDEYDAVHAAADLLSAQTVIGQSVEKSGTSASANGRKWTISVKDGTTIHIDQTASTMASPAVKTNFDAETQKKLGSYEQLTKLFSLYDPTAKSDAKAAGNVLEVKAFDKINEGDKIKIGKDLFTFVSGTPASGAKEIQIGATKDATLGNIATALNTAYGDGTATKESVTLSDDTKGDAIVLRGLNGAAAPALASSGLTLQIGDTADDFNKMTIEVKDMSAKGLGLEGLKVTGIMTEASASKAIDTIKTAINTVSSARAGMGALQNRLEHTINNLDVAAENLSSANSRIRDTDMAKEMMNYTKMNVLVQSAQAMLAQANQQPQSVLQLLQ